MQHQRGLGLSWTPPPLIISGSLALLVNLLLLNLTMCILWLVSKLVLMWSLLHYLQWGVLWEHLPQVLEGLQQSYSRVHLATFPPLTSETENFEPLQK